MKSVAWLFACLAVSAWAQDTVRPQLTAEQAARHTVAAYIAQGPNPWEPADLSAPGYGHYDFLVAANGGGTHLSLQAAIDALPAAGTNARRTTIGLTPGIYSGQVCLQGKAPVRLVGLGVTSADVRIVAGHYNGEAKQAGVQAANPCLPDLAASTFGTASSATLAVFSNDVQLLHMTVENSAMAQVHHGMGYPPGAAESGGAQAVALMTQGDRIQLEDVQLLGHQDTFYVRSVSDNGGDRVYVHRSLIAGDVDFIFGAGTLVVEDSTILSRAGRRSPGAGGHILAPSTAAATPFGFLVHNSRLLAEDGVRPGAISLGRAWDHGVEKGHWQRGLSPNGQVVVRNSVLGPHLAPWAASTSRRPFSSVGEQANRFWEWDNRAVLAPTAVERASLAPNDGWGSADGGTQGGAVAAPEHVYTVRNRNELVAALAPGNFPRIVRVTGRIDLSTDAHGRTLGFEDYRDPEYDEQAFLSAFDPATWGKKPPQGSQEDARQRSARRQSAQMVVRVPSHTTVVGVGVDAGIVNGTLFLERVDNIIIRNIHFSDAYDYFPAWDPKDNANGEWNSEYDNITLRGATHVWIDHCTFDDGARLDYREPVLFGRRVQHHDGLLDITQQSNWVTVSWNHFYNHDKTTLVGSSDAQTLDTNKLKVTFHHNWYQAVKERTPRVRYGQVHVYNNLFTDASDSSYPFGYSLGVGFESRIYSEKNVWVLPSDIRPAQILRVLKGDRFFDRGSVVNGHAVDLVASLKAVNPASSLTDDVGWIPSLHLALDPTEGLEHLVRQGAGAGNLRGE